MATATKTRKTSSDAPIETLVKPASPSLGFTVPTIRLPAKPPQQQEKSCQFILDKRLFEIRQSWDPDFNGDRDKAVVEESKKYGLIFKKSDIKHGKAAAGTLTDSEGRQYSLSASDGCLYQVITLKDFQRLASENKYVVATNGTESCPLCRYAKEMIDSIRNDPRLMEIGVAFIKTIAPSELERKFSDDHVGNQFVSVYDQSGKLIFSRFNIIEDQKDPAGALIKAIEANKR